MNIIILNRLSALSPIVPLFLLIAMALIGHTVAQMEQEKDEQEKRKDGNGGDGQQGLFCLSQKEGEDMSYRHAFEHCPLGIKCMESKCFNGTANVVTKGCAEHGENTCEMEQKKCEKEGSGGGTFRNCTLCDDLVFCNNKLFVEDKLLCYNEQLDRHDHDFNKSSVGTCYGGQCVSLLCIYVRDNNDTAFNITRTCATDGNASCARIDEECVANGGKPSKCVSCTERLCNNMHHPPSKEDIIKWWFKDTMTPTMGTTGTFGTETTGQMGTNGTGTMGETGTNGTGTTGETSTTGTGTMGETGTNGTGTTGETGTNGTGTTGDTGTYGTGITGETGTNGTGTTGTVGTGTTRETGTNNTETTGETGTVGTGTTEETGTNGTGTTEKSPSAQTDATPTEGTEIAANSTTATDRISGNGGLGVKVPPFVPIFATFVRIAALLLHSGNFAAPNGQI